jgi:excisionase family DNA binding protein
VTLLTARAVGRELGVSTETVLRWMRRGELPAIRLPGGAVRFREKDLEAWLEQRATPRRGSVSHPGGRRPSGTVALPSTASATPEDEET